MQRKTIIILAVGSAVVAVLAVLGLREPSRVVSLGKVGKGSFVQSFTEEAKTRLKKRYVVSAPVSGNVDCIELRPGDVVREGQTVAVLAPASSALLDSGNRARLGAEVEAGAVRVRAAAGNLKWPKPNNSSPIVSWRDCAA